MMGHNGGPVLDDRLRSFIERLANLTRDKRTAMKAFAEDIKVVRAEAKGSGYDTKIITATVREMIRREDMGKDDFEEEQELLRLYFRAVGLEV